PTVIDQEKIKIAINTGFLITYEDHHIDTGLGATISIYLAENGIKVKFLRCGIKNYGASGNPDELFKKQGLSPEDLVDTIKYFIKKE
ncbi:MAG: transketolase, partial [Candidatus Omnitrophica bacterium]|nr:transketolase [Candidatus Omnitrophota bacterium]